MKIRLGTIEVDDNFRRALAYHYGIKKLATRDDVRQWAISCISATSDDVIFDYENSESEEEE